MDISQSIVDERVRSSSHSLAETHSSTITLSISFGDLSKENEKLYLVNQAGDRSINETSPNLLFEIKKLRIRNPNKIVIGNFNTNVVMQYIDILVLTKTKHADTFPTVQFLMNDFSEPYRHNRNRNGGGVLIYIREDIPSKHVFP